MKALVISPQPFFSPRGTPFSVYYRSLVLSELGVEVDLLTYGEGQQVDIPKLRTIRIPRFAALGHVKTGPSALKAFLDMFMVIWTVALLVRHRYDVVHAHEEAVFWCRFLKPIFGFKLIYDMHSSLPQQLSNFDFTKSKLIRGAFEWLENSAIRSSNAVITICPDLRDYVNGLGNISAKHVLIENSIFEPVNLVQAVCGSETPGTECVELPAGRLIVYAGTLEHYQGIDLIVDAMAFVRESVPDARLIVVGGTPDQVGVYRQRAISAGLDDCCSFTGRVPKSQADAYISNGEVLLSPRTEGTNTPLKIYQQLASGKPLVATDIYSHTQVLTDEVAFLAQPEAESMGKAVIDALSNPAHAQLRAAAALEVYETHYARDSYVAKMKDLLAALGGPQ